MRILFIHIPKTAGTSVLTMMKNLFGDDYVLRLSGHDFGEIADKLKALAENDFEDYQFIAGHLPVSLFSDYLNKLKILTFLRHPVQRIFSLYRFLKQQSVDELTRLGLTTDFSINELLESKNPELYGQVNNGMCRQLSSNFQRTDSAESIFWENSTDILFAEAYTTLILADFGIVEDMNDSIHLLCKSWHCPVEWDIGYENQTEKSSVDDSSIIEFILKLNQADMKLYDEAVKLYQLRKKFLGLESSPFNLLSLDNEITYRISKIPCRQGFYEVESDGFAWIREGKQGVFHFSLTNSACKQITVCVYPLGTEYPVIDSKIFVNEKLVAFEVVKGKFFFQLVLSPIELEKGIIKISLCPPVFFKATAPDNRKLGLAVAWVRI